MRLSAPFVACGEHAAIDLPGGRALFTTRRGGRSEGPFRSLNLGRFSALPDMPEDDLEAVAANRARVAELAGVEPAGLVGTRQVHGTEVLELDEAPAPGAPPRSGDGQLTARHGLAPMALAADCVPIALASGGAVAVLHGGWRGLAGGIVGTGVAALRAASGAGPVHAAIGPGIGPCCYEVGDDVLAAFPRHRDAARDGSRLDLKAVARAELLDAGVEVVHDIDLCTACSNPELFFSHRRDRGVTGRQAGVVWRT